MVSKRFFARILDKNIFTWLFAVSESSEPFEKVVVPYEKVHLQVLAAYKMTCWLALPSCFLNISVRGYGT